MKTKQQQSGGDHSVNVQANHVSVGLDYESARQIALDVFEANFIKLSREAAEVAQSRAESLVQDYLRELAAKDERLLNESKDPDMQYSLFIAQREFARSGAPDLGEMLVQLLVDRASQPDRSLLQIVLNESLEVVPKLTPDQLDALTLVFLLRYSRNQAIIDRASLGRYLDDHILPFVSGLPSKHSAYQHLAFTGCANIQITEVGLEKIFRETYPGVFMEGFDPQEIRQTSTYPSGLFIEALHAPGKVQLGAMDQQTLEKRAADLGLNEAQQKELSGLFEENRMRPEAVKATLLSLRPQVAPLFEQWGSTPLRNLTLTSVGIAISHGNFRRRTGARMDLSIWI